MPKNKVAPWVSAVPGGSVASDQKKITFVKDLDIKIKDFYASNRRVILLCVYCVYLAIISLTGLQAHGPGDSSYISTAAISRMLSRGHNLADYSTWPVTPNYPRSYLDVGNFGDFFEWLPSLSVFLLPQTHYNWHSPPQATVGYAFILLGNITIRQVRVSASSCVALPSFQTLVNSSECFGELGYSGDAQSTFRTATGRYYMWREEQLLKSGSYFGQYNVYPGGGYFMALPTDPAEFVSAANELLGARWLDLGTRVVFVDLLLYNPSSLHVFEVKIVFECPPSGGVFPFLDIRSARYADLFVTSDSTSELGLQILLLIFTVFYLIWQCASWWNVGSRQYWSAQGDQSWVYFEWTKHSCVVAGFVFKFWAYSFTEHAGMFPPPKGHSTNLGIALTYLMLWKVFLSFGLMFAWIQTLQFMSHFSSVQLFVNTCVKCLPAVLPFVVTYLILTSGTAFAFCLQFSDSVYTAKSMSFSFMFTFVAFVSGYDFSELYSSNRVMGPVLHIFWFFVASILANNFIVALIMAKMQQEQKAVGPSVSILDYLHSLYSRYVPPAVSEDEEARCAAVLIQSVVRGHFGRQLASKAAEVVLEDEQAAATYSRSKKAESRSRLLDIGSDIEKLKAMADAKAMKHLIARADEVCSRVQVAGAQLSSVDAGKHALISQLALLQQVFDKLALVAEGGVVASHRQMIHE